MGDLEKFFSLNLKEGAMFVVAIILIGVLIISKWDYIIERFGITTKKAIKEQEQSDAIKKLQEHAEKTDNNFDAINHNLEELRQCLHGLSDQVAAMGEKNDAAERNRLRDRIGQAYRYYSDRGEWTSMEKEAFDGLISSYESAGGQNGFVHTVCIPASLGWRIIE